MKKLMMMSVSVALLPLFCFASEDYTYQSLTNLGPCASSRVLLMNNDTNEICPIQGQGYYDTNETTTAVGGTFWWHDEAPAPLSGSFAALYLNLLAGTSHVLYQKTDAVGGRKALWTLVQCRAGAGGYHGSGSSFEQCNYLPWSGTCVPIAPESYPEMPIPDGVNSIYYPDYGMGDLAGIKQVAQINMRYTSDAIVYSPFYEDGIGEIYFDVVNGWHLPSPDSIQLDVAEDIVDGLDDASFEDGLDWDSYRWKAVPCDLFVVEDKQGLHLPESNHDIKTMQLNPTKYGSTLYYRVRARLNIRGPVRFRIRRTAIGGSSSNLDWGGLIYIDNIIVSYPGVEAEVSSGGFETKAPVDTDNRKNGKHANLGYVGAFSEPLLCKGIETARPRMSFSAVTNGLPSFVAPCATVSRAECVYRWRYLDQAFGPWKTNSEDNISIVGGTNVVWKTPIEIPDEIGDIEYSYGAWVAGTRYRYFDFANDTRLGFPDDTASETYVQCATNYFSRIRTAPSPWQEMHVISEVITNAATLASVTNDWTMDLVSSNTWRGFVDTRTNYFGNTAYIRIQGRNRWESGGATPSLESFTWYMPELTGIPDGYKALTEPPGEDKENFITLDCSTAYLVIDFNDEDGSFTLNRAEYQDFNRWTPPAGSENKYVGDCVNTTYVGRAKQSYILEASGWDYSRSSSPFWWENFDEYAGNRDFPFNVPYGQNSLTPNGWTFDNGMYVNGFFTAQTNKTTCGMALQLQGGIGSVGLIDPLSKPNGIGTVGFSARLAQTLDFDDFYCYLGGFTDKNYAFSAKVAMTHTLQHNSYPSRNDVSTGSPSVSLVACYRPGYGCYEVRMTRVWGSYTSALWGAGDGVMELAIYRWNHKKDSDGNTYWTTKKLASKRLGTNTTYVRDAAGRQYDRGNYLAPVSTSAGVDNDKWTSMFIAVYGVANGTYIEGAISEEQVATYTNPTLSGDALLQQAVTRDMGVSGRMFNISFTDREIETNVVNGVEKHTKLYHEKGTYGLCSTECPAAFGALNRHALNEAGPYYASASKFKTSELQRESLADNDWGSVSLGRMMSWADFDNDYPNRDSYVGVWQYGVCAAPVSQRLNLLLSTSGNSSSWSPTSFSLLLESYQPTNIVFSPHTLEPTNLKLAVGSSRTDVVVDDLQLSQWKGETSRDSLCEMRDWAYTGGWITTTTNDFYQNAGASTDDPLAKITKCGFIKYKVDDADDEYVYVFTNTTAGALSGYARFVPNMDLTVLSVFGIGGGGGGGAGGGGGGGGGAFQITNAANYSIGEELRVNVGLGGNSSGWNASASGGTPRAVNGSNYGTSSNGGNTYFYGRTIGSSTKTARTTYYGYGGGRGGNWRDTSSGTEFAQGQVTSSGRCAGGGSARPRANPSGAAFTVDTDRLSNGGNGRYQGCGVGAGVTNNTEAAGGGGGGGLVTYTSGTVNFSNTNNVTYAGRDGSHGVAGAQAGNGGRGFPISAIGSAVIRKAIMDLTGLSEDDRLGGGGGGGAGTNATANATVQGFGSISAGKGLDGGSDGAVPAATYNASFGATDADRFRGGGGGGGAIHAVLQSGGNNARNWLTRGGRGGDGLLVMHVRVNSRSVLLQPMRGDPTKPMSVSTPLLDGISMLGFSWRWADTNAEVHVQVNTNGVNEGNIDGVREGRSLSEYWVDVGIVKFSEMSAEAREAGSTNFAVGIRSPISGIARLLIATNIVNDARNNATNAAVSSMYGAVAITAMLAMDEPSLEDRSWWGWNIMPTGLREYGSLYDHLYDTSYDPMPGRSCALNFSGKPGTGEDDPQFADPSGAAGYDRHDPFIQTPNFTNGIGQVTFLARMLETNGVSGWVTICGATNPDAADEEWVAITNIAITADSPFFQRYALWMPAEYSNITAVRLSAYAAKDGRYAAQSPYAPEKIQRVLIDDVLATQPLTPTLAFAYPPRPYRYNGTKVGNPAALPTEQILSPDEQPLLCEPFGMQVQLLPAGAEEHLDRNSIRVYMSWYAGESPWGFANWRNQNGAVLDIELVRAEGWSENNLIYHSSPEDVSGLIPPHVAGENGYQVVQYHIYVTYRDMSGYEHVREMSVGSDWTEPPWYTFANGNPYNQGSVKCAYTILDSISPESGEILPDLSISNGTLYGVNTKDATSVSIPASVTNIGAYAFYQCAALRKLIFSGNAPTVNGLAFVGCNPSCTVYVPRGSTGWGVTIPGTWNGMRIEYLVPVENDVMGAIRSIDRCDQYGVVQSPGTIGEALTVGERAYFRIRLENHNSQAIYRSCQTHGNLRNPWYFWDAINDRPIDPVQADVKVGVFVGGRFSLADVILATDEPFDPSDGGGPWFTDLICSYTVQPGDLALPMTLANSNKEEAGSYGTTAYFLGQGHSLLTSDTRVQLRSLMHDEDGDWNDIVSAKVCSFRFGDYWSDNGCDYLNMSGRVFAKTSPGIDYTLFNAGIFIQSIDFDRNVETDDNGNDVWRVVREGSAGTAHVPSLYIPGDIPTNGCVYLWTADADSVRVLPGSNGMIYNYNGKQVMKLTFDGTAESLQFQLSGVTRGTSTEIFLSSSPTNVYSPSGVLITNFLSRMVACINPLLPGVAVLAGTGEGVQSVTLNATTDYTVSTPFRVNLTNPWTNNEDVVVKFRYTVNGEEVLPANIIALSNDQIFGYEDPLPLSVTIPAGETDSTELPTNVRALYVLGALTASAMGDKIVIEPYFENGAMATFFPDTKPLTLTIYGMNPDILSVNGFAPADVASGESVSLLSVRGGVTSEFAVRVNDTYRNMFALDGTNGYFTVTWLYEGGAKTVITNDVNGAALIPDSDGILHVPMMYPVPVSDQNMLTTVKVRNADGRESEKSFYVYVKQPKNVTATLESAVVGEGGSPKPVTFTLSETAASSTLYAFLEPASPAASNLSYAAFFTTNAVETEARGAGGAGVPFTPGNLVAVSDELLSGNGLQFFDNSSGLFVYNVRLCSSPTWDPAARVTEFIENQLVITVTNNAPVITQVLAKNNATGLDKLTTSMIVMSLSDPMRTFRVSLLSDVDLDKNGVESNQVVYAWEAYKWDDSINGYPAAPNLVFYTVGLNSSLNMEAIFGSTLTEDYCGRYKFCVYAQDKDMRGKKPQYLYEEGGEWKYDPWRGLDMGGAVAPAYPEGNALIPGNDWSEAYTFELRIDEKPYVVLNAFGASGSDIDGTPIFRECDFLNCEQMGFTVGFNDKPGISGFLGVPVAVTITPVDADGNEVDFTTYSEGVPPYVVPTVSPTNFSFTASVWSNKFTFTDFDGIWWGRGLTKKGMRYRLVATVTSTSASSSGTPWNELYTPATNYFRLENSAPVVTVDPDYEGQDSEANAVMGITYALNQHFNFRWAVSDVPSDCSQNYTDAQVAALGPTNLIVTCSVVGGYEVGAITNQSSGTFSVWFEKPGINKLRISATDKDGDVGYSKLIYFYVDGNVDGETSGGETVSVPVSWIRNVLNVPDEWLSTHPSLVTSLLNATSANGKRTVAECYALGLDPEEATNDFRIVSIRMVDGKPQVEWEPKSNRWMGVELNTKLKGAVNLNDKEWSDVTEENKGLFRFFKVEVVLP